MTKNIRRIVFINILLIIIPLITSCTKMGTAVDPRDWHYDCVVIYDSLGGTINSREVRETYYMKNSYLFKPSGTTNMLIEPVKDGYILAGWYTRKEDILDNDGKVIGYSFRAEDRWDFNEDRVQGDMTLYARWIPQGKVEYIDTSTGSVMFSKNITANSPVQKLSSAAEKLVAKEGFTLYGYYFDKECTIPYEFSDYTHSELIPSGDELYARLYEEFPEYFRKAEYVKPSENEEETHDVDTSDLYINKLGYEIVTDDKEARQRIRNRKDEIIEEYIMNYISNTSEKTVYLKYIQGDYIRVNNLEDIKAAGKYGFAGVNSMGNPVDGYILQNDIDFKNISYEMVEKFSGKIYGNGYRIKNIAINISSRKLDNDTSKEAGLFKNLEDAYIENVVFENTSINISVNSGIPVTVGAFAIQASNTTLNNVSFDTLVINTGKGDDGAAKYKISDLFSVDRNNRLENVTGENVEINASEYADINSYFESDGH